MRFSTSENGRGNGSIAQSLRRHSSTATASRFAPSRRCCRLNCDERRSLFTDHVVQFGPADRNITGRERIDENNTQLVRRRRSCVSRSSASIRSNCSITLFDSAVFFPVWPGAQRTSCCYDYAKVGTSTTRFATPRQTQHHIGEPVFLCVSLSLTTNLR